MVFGTQNHYAKLKKQSWAYTTSEHANAQDYKFVIDFQNALGGLYIGARRIDGIEAN
jgi:hypothetical protein